MFFDPMYLLFVLPAMLLAAYAQYKVHSAYTWAKQLPAASGLSGAEAASRILQSSGLPNVQIERAQGVLGDHYDPRHKVLRLSDEVYSGRSLASLGIAAHEAGHAIQDAQRYAPLVLRNGIVPMAAIGSNFSMVAIFLGAIMQSSGLILLGVALFSLVVLFQLINLPVEYDASARAKRVLTDRGLISPSEQGAVSKVLSAAALTYVAATLSAILTLLYYVWHLGLFGRDDDR